MVEAKFGLRFGGYSVFNKVRHMYKIKMLMYYLKTYCSCSHRLKSGGALVRKHVRPDCNYMYNEGVWLLICIT